MVSLGTDQCNCSHAHVWSTGAFYCHGLPEGFISRLGEGVAVEALGFVLSRSDAARRALRDLLQLEGLDVGELTGVKTQVSDAQ